MLVCVRGFTQLNGHLTRKGIVWASAKAGDKNTEVSQTLTRQVVA